MARRIEVRYFAAAADAAGCATEGFDVPDAAVVGDVRGLIGERHGAAMARVLRVAAFLVGDDLTRDDAHPIGDRVDVLPPFAGG